MLVTAEELTDHPIDPVPLYLIPQIISGEIRRHGGTISEMNIRRTGGHIYAITIRTRTEGGESDAA